MADDKETKEIPKTSGAEASPIKIPLTSAATSKPSGSTGFGSFGNKPSTGFGSFTNSSTGLGFGYGSTLGTSKGSSTNKEAPESLPDFKPPKNISASNNPSSELPASSQPITKPVFGLSSKTLSSGATGLEKTSGPTQSTYEPPEKIDLFTTVMKPLVNESLPSSILHDDTLAKLGPKGKALFAPKPSKSTNVEGSSTNAFGTKNTSSTDIFGGQPEAGKPFGVTIPSTSGSGENKINPQNIQTKAGSGNIAENPKTLSPFGHASSSKLDSNTPASTPAVGTTTSSFNQPASFIQPASFNQPASVPVSVQVSVPAINQDPSQSNPSRPSAFGQPIAGAFGAFDKVPQKTRPNIFEPPTQGNIPMVFDERISLPSNEPAQRSRPNVFDPPLESSNPNFFDQPASSPLKGPPVASTSAFFSQASSSASHVLSASGSSPFGAALSNHVFEPNAPTTSSTPKGFTIGSTPKGVTIGSTPKGVTIGSTSKGVTIGSTPKAASSGSTPAPSSLGQSAPAPAIVPDFFKQSGAASTSSPAPPCELFGKSIPAATTPSASGSNSFGQSAAITTPSASGSNPFGQSAAATTTPSASGSNPFGQSAAATTTPSASGSNPFGQSAAATTTPSASGSIPFGQSAATTTPTSTSIPFGQSAATTTPTSTSIPFGQSAATTAPIPTPNPVGQSSIPSTSAPAASRNAFGQTTTATGSTSAGANFSGTSAATPSGPNKTVSFGATSVFGAGSSDATSAARSAPPLSELDLASTIQEFAAKTLDSLKKAGERYSKSYNDIAAWDNLITINGGKINQINKTVDELEKEQKSTLDFLNYLDRQQDHLEVLLDRLDSDITFKKADSNHKFSEFVMLEHQIAEDERGYIYSLAEEINIRISEMTNQLQEVVDVSNSLVIKAIESIDEQSAPQLQVYHDSFQQVNKKVKQLEVNLSKMDNSYN